jgi:branched-chain amino acid transport system substrate-binding protein
LGSFGADFTRGIELAVEQMNTELEAAGVGVRFEIASADTEGTPDGAARAVQTIVQTTGAQVVVGPLTTSEVLGAKQFADENGIVLVAPASSGAAGAIPGDNIFRVMYPSDIFAAKAFAGIAIGRGYTDIAILHVDDPFGNGLVEQFTADFQAAGGGEVSVTAYAPDPVDLTGEATKLSAEAARLDAEGDAAVFCVCFLADAQKLLQVAMVDPVLSDIDWMGIENLANPEILEDAGHTAFLQNANFVTVSFADSQTPLTQPFVESFTAKFGDEPGPFTNYAFDAANIAMLTMLITGDDGEAVKSMLPFVSNHYIGTAVQAYLDANGDQAIARYGVYRVADDGSEFVLIGNYDGSSGQLAMDE